MTIPTKYIACIIPRIPFFALRTSHSTALYFILSSNPLPSKLRFIGLSQHQNNVGYNSQTLNDGLTGSVAAFQGVNNSENLPISALTPVSASLYSEAISIQTLDTFGVMAKTYLYITDKDYGDYGLETPGWIDMDQYGEGVLAEKVFDPSEGFLAVNSLADAQLKFPAVIPAE